MKSKPQTVLVVDDDPDIVDFLHVALEGLGYRVLSALDGCALSLARKDPPDLILLDLLMPGMDGVEVSQRLRAHPTTANIPIVIMSAHERLLSSAPSIAADDRLPKPFELDDLYNTVARWVRGPDPST
jgi:CheY-like chemotaxis protein